VRILLLLLVVYDIIANTTVIILPGLQDTDTYIKYPEEYKIIGSGEEMQDDDDSSVEVVEETNGKKRNETKAEPQGATAEQREERPVQPKGQGEKISKVAAGEQTADREKPSAQVAAEVKNTVAIGDAAMEIEDQDGGAGHEQEQSVENEGIFRFIVVIYVDRLLIKHGL